MNKDDEFDEKFQATPDSDLDGDFGEFDQEGEKGSLGDLVKNPAVKIGLIVAGLVVIVGAITLFGGTKEKAPDSVVGSGNQSLKSKPGSEELSPEMKAVVEQYNQDNIEKAMKEGTSVIPQPVETPKEALPFPKEETAAEDPLLRWRQMQDERLKAQQTEQNNQKQAEDPAKAQAVQALAGAMNAQMSQILSAKKITLKSMEVTSIQDFLAARKAQAEQNAQASAQTSAIAASGIDPTTGLPLTPANILLPAGAIEYAQLLIEANSDVPGPIVGMIVSGPFSGSRVLGSFQRKEKLLVMQFNMLVDKKGISIPIQAYALDPDTTLTAMATDVDNRYWERIILPATADFVEGLGEAYADRQSDTTIVTGDVVVQSEPELNVEEQVAAGVEKAAERVSDILSEEGDNTQPLIIVRAGTPMGLLFMAPITDQDQMAGRNSPTSARVLAQQQQQQSLLQQQSQDGQPNNPFYLIQSLQGAQGLQAGQPADANQNNSTSGNTTSGTGLPSNIFMNRQ